MKSLKLIVKTFGRWWLGWLTRLTLLKHRPVVIVITGGEQTSIMRETLYYVSREHMPTRRNIELPEAEFSIPITVLDYPAYPNSKFGWLALVCRACVQLITVRPYRHSLVLEVAPVTQQVWDYWLRVLQPAVIVEVGESNYTDLQGRAKYYFRLSAQAEEEDVHRVAREVGGSLGMDEMDVELGLSMVNFPEPRVRFFTGSGGQMVVDATHYYMPLHLESVIEMLPGEGKRAAFTDYKLDQELLRQQGWEVNPEGTDFEVVLLRGSRVRDLQRYAKRLGLRIGGARE